MGAARVISPGLFTSVQDLGRVGHGAMGVAEGGAADALSLRAANRVVGNDDGAPALEMTLVGAKLEFVYRAVVAIGGCDVEAHVLARDGSQRPVRTWAAVEIDAGDALHVGAIVRGARAYLSVSGGWNGEPVFKSVSTHFSAGFGGHEGRALRAGDRLEFTSGTPAPREAKALRELPESARAFLRGEIERKALRAIEGTPAHVGQFDEAALSKFWKGAFAVSSKSDRSGVRLEGEPIRAGGKATGNGGAMISEGMVRGAVQVPPNGLPIVLGADYPTTGGYPVIACVASVDFPALGQARPGDVLRFERVTLGRALELLRERERRFEEEVPRT